MKPGDKIKVIKGEYMGRFGWIKEVNLSDFGTSAEESLTIIDEHKHTYPVRRDDVELVKS
ncbi:KOW motif-containing protein [Chloroflexota bacterium]